MRAQGAFRTLHTAANRSLLSSASAGSVPGGIATGRMIYPLVLYALCFPHDTRPTACTMSTWEFLRCHKHNRVERRHINPFGQATGVRENTTFTANRYPPLANPASVFPVKCVVLVHQHAGFRIGNRRGVGLRRHLLEGTLNHVIPMIG